MQSKIFLIIAATTLLSINISAQSPASGTVNGHEYVDLGLSVKWATCNIGAEKSEDYGSHFAWGETCAKSEFTIQNSKYYDVSICNYSGNKNYDAATAQWGDMWRTPTHVEFKELLDSCTWQWLPIGGHKGYVVTSKINGKCIFLPAAGRRNDSAVEELGIVGQYLASSVCERDNNQGYGLFFTNEETYTCKDYRSVGQTVRPVSDAFGKNLDHEYVDLGLSVLWASCNVGASQPEDYGDYFACGETQTKLTYTLDNCKYGGKSILSISGNPKYDAATATWGSSWCMPTESELRELIDSCSWQWTTVGGKTGYKVTSIKNGNSIFLPTINNRNSGDYWSASPNAEGYKTAFACAATIDSCKVNYVYMNSDAKSLVRPVLAVKSKKLDHEYVDLGLSVMWAICNLGAKNPYDAGERYAWGMTTTQTQQSTSYEEYLWYAAHLYQDLYDDLSRDAARANWGGSWRLPTEKEQAELVENCTWQLTTIGGHDGYLGISKKNGNSIFLPAAGTRYEASLDSDENGYWSSTPAGEFSIQAMILYFTNDEQPTADAYMGDRSVGMSVRPVAE